jgi:D-glycero-alpha-D-manno-heptose 1-phosphate guanylyltransferase
MRNPMPDAIILAGGLGTRLQQTVPDLPKSMAPVGGKPFLEYLIKYLENNFVQHAVLSLGYKADDIIRPFGSVSGKVKLTFSVEDQPLGTGGAVMKAFSPTGTEHVIILNGDTLFDVDLPEMFQQHIISKAAVTIALHEAQDAGRYGAVVTNTDGRIVLFQEKQPGRGLGQINGGIYIVRREFLEQLNLPEKFSIEKEVFQAYCDELPFYGYYSSGYFIDIGIPADYNRANDELPEIIRL